MFCLLQKNARAQTAAALQGDVREQFVQRALQLRKEENYSGAITQLDSILKYNAADAPILLFKGDLQLQQKQFGNAANTYQILLPLKYETTIATINLSYALFMNHQPAKALQFARQAWQQNKTSNSAVVNYFNALLWNIKTKEAAVFLKQQTSLLTAAQQLVLKARLYTTSGNYKSGLQYYDSLVKTYPDKYYVQEYAEVLLGKKEIAQSQHTMQNARQLFSTNEYNAYLQKVTPTTLQNAGTEFVYFKDVAKNTRIESNIWWQQSEKRRYRFRINAGTSSITDVLNQKTTGTYGQLHIDERWNKAWSGETDVRLQIIKPQTASFSALTGTQTIKYQPNDRRMIGVSLSTDILNFTADIFGKNIRSTNAGYVTHILLSGKTGFFSQGSAGFISDKNQRYLMFASLYRLFRTEPTFKTGINFSALHFSNSNIKTYFSPNRYFNTEVFADYSTALPMLSKFYLQAQAAGGMQQIEKQLWQSALRLQTEIGLRLKQFETSLKYQTSNAASSTGTGYKFNWFTLRAMYKW